MLTDLCDAVFEGLDRFRAVGPFNIIVQTSLGILSDSCGKEFRLPWADVTNFYFDLFSKTPLTTGIAEKTFGQPA